jgi:hypothetical protein
VRRGDGQVSVGQGARQAGQQARAVAAGGLDHGGGLRGLVVQHDGGRDGEGGGAAHVALAAGLAGDRLARGGGGQVVGQADQHPRVRWRRTAGR